MIEPRYETWTSDHHWATGGPDDAFAIGTRRKRYWRFLDYVEDIRSGYNILGDLGDCLIARGPAIIEYYRDEFNRLHRMRTRYAAGNHDAQWLGPRDTLPQHPFFDRASERFTLDIAGRKFLCLHGHQGDRYCDKPYPDLDGITALITARRARRRGRPVSGRPSYRDLAAGVVGWLGTIGRRLLGKPSRLDETISGVECIRERAGHDGVIYGHTHIAGRISDYHYNCGMWSGLEGEETFVQADRQTGEVKPFRWSMDCKAVEIDRELKH